MNLEDIARCVELPLATVEEPAREEPHEQTENGIAAQPPNSLNTTTDVKTIYILAITATTSFLTRVPISPGRPLKTIFRINLCKNGT